MLDCYNVKKVPVEGINGFYTLNLYDTKGKEIPITDLIGENINKILEEKTVINLYDFEKAVKEYKEGKEEALRKIIIPAEIVSKLFPSIEIKEDSVGRIFHGSPIHEDEATKKEYSDHKKGEKLVVFSKENFIGIFKVINEGNLFARSEFTLQPIN